MERSVGDDRTMVGPGCGNESSKASLSPGDRLGQYRIIRLLGRGGMGEVYEVEHTVLRRRYALKLLPADFASRSEALARFKREAEVMASLEHPNILKVDDFGETDGLYWLRMELAEGGRCRVLAPKGRDHRSPGLSDSATLGSQCGASAPEGRHHRSPGSSDSATLGSDIDNELCPEGESQSSVIVRSLAEYAEAKGGRLSPDEAQVIFTQILEGLAQAHASGTIHRDLKPANILIFADEDGNATFKISDFGLVRMVGEEWVRSQADQSIRLSISIGNMATEMPESVGSSTRSLIGTYEYMSPEQKRGEDATAASDVYAVGLMMYRLLTGRSQPGFKAPSEEITGLDSAWDRLLLTALEEDAGDRFRDAVRMLAELPGTAAPSREPLPSVPDGKAKEVSHPPPIPLPTTSPPAGSRRSCPWLWLAGIVALVVALVAIALLFGGATTRVKATVPVAGWDGHVEELRLELVWVTPGSFRMVGTPSGGNNNERPVREVRISRGFWLGKYEVTQREYQAIMGENPSQWKGDNLPVESVRWHKAVEFCEKLTERERRAGRLPEGYVYRLPTDAEWEYSARGGHKSREDFTFAGSNIVDEVAWYSGNSDRTHEVGKLKPNELGLYDMSGNVREWVHDWYQDSYSGLATTDPSGPGTGSHRVLRGGCWRSTAGFCRVAYRSRSRPSRTDFYLGFRVALGPPL